MGESGADSHRQRQMLDYMNDRILEVHRKVVALSVQVTQMSIELERMRGIQSEEQHMRAL
jgi:hypothetical protein